MQISAERQEIKEAKTGTQGPGSRSRKEGQRKPPGKCREGQGLEGLSWAGRVLRAHLERYRLGPGTWDPLLQGLYLNTSLSHQQITKKL